MKKILLLVCFLLLGATIYAEEKINLMAELLPPYQYYNENKV